MIPAIPLAAVLLDLDGTLLDTAPDLARALNTLRSEQQLAPLAFLSHRSVAVLLRWHCAGRSPTHFRAFATTIRKPRAAPASARILRVGG